MQLFSYASTPELGSACFHENGEQATLAIHLTVVCSSLQTWIWPFLYLHS